MNRSNKNIYNILLEKTNTQIVRDPVWNNIVINPSISPLLNSIAMQRLRRISQLGPISLVYPGTTHTRYAHSIGVYHISQRILLHILSDPYCPEISLIQAKSFLASALLHDIGHFPYAHSLKELPLPSHEEIGAKIILEDLRPYLEEYEISASLCAAIISPNTLEVAPEDKEVLHLFSQILSSAMDPDKLDYLCRDAFYGGVPYGFQDIDFAIQQIYFDKNGIICYASMLPLEHILFSKYLMYSSMYWHKKVRAATAMVKYSLFRALREYSIQKDSLIMLDDLEFHTLCNSIDSKSMIPARNVQNARCFEMLFEIGFSEEFAVLIDLEIRSKLEDLLRELWSVDFVIIDVPEDISFEIPKEGLNASVFTPKTVQAFVENIRKLRIFIFPSLKSIKITREELEMYLTSLI